MRNRGLHDALRDFALDAAALLTADVKSGAELAYDLEEEPGSGPVLYHYRPLTSGYIEARWPRVAMTPSFDPAVRALGSGASGYLNARGIAGGDAEPALRAMLERLYDDATSFDFPEERFERVYAEVELTLYEHTARTSVVAPLLGMWMEPDRVDLGEGFALVRGNCADAPPEAVWPERREPGSEPNVLLVLERDQHSDLELPITQARAGFHKLLTSLRLFRPGALAFGPLAWARADEGVWRPVPLGHTGHLRGDWWVLGAAEQDELRAFLDLAGASKHGGVVGWALSRFELGLERVIDTEALSDYLLALRALFDGGDDTGRASLSLRLAALCAENGERRALQQRVELAFALERFVIGGGTDQAYVEAIGAESPHDLVLEVEGHVRAVLRDVLCGYLDPDLKTAADEVLLKSSDPVHISARDLREAPEPDPWEEEYTEGEPEPEPEPEPELVAESGVTPSADWDEDPASYSAPV